MVQKLFFNSSLPRSLSTLFQNVMGQNPDIYVTPTSGVLELVYSAQALYSSSPEFKAQDTATMEKAWLGFCRKGLHGYFDAITDKPYVIDKSRGWQMKFSFLEKVFDEKPKIICLVRDLKGIIASLEKIHRESEKTHFTSSVDHSKLLNTTTAKRVDSFFTSPPLGIAIERVQESLLKGWSNDMLFIRAEDLASYPQKQIARVYKYLQIPEFEHDFDNVEQLTTEDDNVYNPGAATLHTIRRKIEPLRDDSERVLGPEICNWIDTNPRFDWYNKTFGYGKYKTK